jgi:hypothetical protein
MLKRYDIHGIDDKKQLVGTDCPSKVTVILLMKDVYIEKFQEPMFYVPDQPAETIIVHFGSLPEIVLRIQCEQFLELFVGRQCEGVYRTNWHGVIEPGR